MSAMEFTDRYQALGIPYPDPAKMCKGQCEGVGVVPVKGAPSDTPGMVEPTAECDPTTDPVLLRLWAAAEAESHADDGWHFVACPTCSGSGLAS